MKIMNKAGILLIAASAAAVVGISSVSFAAWSGGVDTGTTETNSTGYIKVLGWNEDASLDVEGADLVPYDQPNADLNGQSQVITVTIPEYDYTVSHKITIESDNSTLDLRYIYNNESDCTLPADANGLTGWTSISTEKTEINAVDVTSNAVQSAAVSYVHIILVSDSTQDMNKDFTVTISLVEAE